MKYIRPISTFRKLKVPVVKTFSSDLFYRDELSLSGAQGIEGPSNQARIKYTDVTFRKTEVK